MDESTGETLRNYFAVLKRRWGIIVLVIALFTGGALAISLRMTKTYTAVAEINITPFISPSASSADILNMLTNPTLGMQTDVSLIESAAVLSPAAQSLGLTSKNALVGSVKASLVLNTQIISVQASSPSPARAAVIANAVAQAFLDYQRNTAISDVAAAGKDLSSQIDSLEAQIQAAGSSPASATAVSGLNADLTTLRTELAQLPGLNSIVTGGGSIPEPAPVPTSPSSPRVKVNVALGLFLGLVLAVGLVLLIEALDDRLRSAEDVEAVTAEPILGSVPLTDELATETNATALIHSPTSSVAEAYRTIRTNLQFMSVERPIRTLLVTSSIKGEGKSTTAANLAAAFAVSGMRTILVSADLRRPSVHRFFGLENTRGVVDAILPNVPLEQVLQGDELPDLRLLAAGRVPPNPAEILGSRRFAEILDQLASAADLVIIDSPPLLGVSDASVLASRVDGVLLIVNTAQVTRRALAHAHAQLGKVGGRLLGEVLNAVSASLGKGYGYDYDYRYYTSENEASEKKTRRRGRRRREADTTTPAPVPVKAAPTPKFSSRESDKVADVPAPASSNGHRDGDLGSTRSNGLEYGGHARDESIFQETRPGPENPGLADPPRKDG